MKTHIKLTRDPLTEGHSYRVECGVEIRNAHLEFTWDSDTKHMEGLSTLRFCADCIEEAFKATCAREYIYGISEGELAKQEEAVA